MAKFNVVVDHETQRAHAVSRLKTFSVRMREDVPVEVTEVEEVWDEAGNLDFSFKAMGYKVSGKMVTCEYKVTIAGQIPFAALPFRGAIESQIADKVKEAVNDDEEIESEEALTASTNIRLERQIRHLLDSYVHELPLDLSHQPAPCGHGASHIPSIQDSIGN